MRNTTPIIVAILIALGTIGCQAQNDSKMEEKNNPLLCDPQEGVCGTPENTEATHLEAVTVEKSIKVIYFTDPICSACWGIEPQLRKLKAEYGDHIEIEYHMGGLLPDWSYNSGGISKPSDVAHHWDEVSAYYDMPIDGDVWLEDPLDSSYPPSIAFKAAEMQDPGKAQLFMREIREMVFLQKKNIAKWENLETAAKTVGLDPQQLKNDYENYAKPLFEQDLQLAKKMGVRGFPTLFFANDSGQSEILYGAKPYSSFESAVHKLDASIEKQSFADDWKTLFSKHNSLTAKEFALLSNTPRKDCEAALDKLVNEGALKKIETKNGDLWREID